MPAKTRSKKNNNKTTKLNALATQIQNHMNKIRTGKMPTISQANFGRILKQLENNSGMTFTMYKMNMNRRK